MALSYTELVRQVETLKDQKRQLEIKQRKSETENKTLHKKLEGGYVGLDYYDNDTTAWHDNAPHAPLTAVHCLTLYWAPQALVGWLQSVTH